MAPRAPPTSHFELWACARLRSLYEARCDDNRRGITSRKNSKFGSLMRTYMEEYGNQPFASSSWEGHTGGRSRVSDAALRKQADQYLRNHSVAPLARLAAFESAGGIAADHPHKAAAGIELWGSGGAEGARINKLVCAELGIPADTAAADRPDGWISVRKTIIKREFDLLPEAEQKEWQELADDRRVQVAKAALPVVVQDRQEEFRAQLSAMVTHKMANGGLGRTFVVQFKGFFIGEEDRVVHQFRGRAASYDAPDFYKTAESTEKVIPLWAGFIRKQTEGYTVPRLPKLTKELSDDELNERRILLKSWFELMFDLTVDMPDAVDNEKFWADVSERPSDFIADYRIPDGTRFDDPTKLADDEFKLLYRHVYNSQNKREQLDDDGRVLFEQSAIEGERAAHCAARLKRMHAKKRAGAGADFPGTEDPNAALEPVQGGVESEVAGNPAAPIVPSTLASVPTPNVKKNPAGGPTKKRKRPSSEEVAAMSESATCNHESSESRPRRAPGRKDSRASA